MMLVIGNCISFAAALFMVASCTVKDRRRIFIYQSVNAALLAAASVFFQAYAGIVTIVVSSLRNYLIAVDKYNKKLMTATLFILTVPAVLANNRGLTGLIPVAATIQYTLCSYYIRNIKLTKVSIFVNEAAWCVYGLTIMDIPSFISDGVSAVVAIVSLFIMVIKENTANPESN